MGLLKTLSSLATLAYHPNIQFICVDGGSTDGSIEVAREFYDPLNLTCGPDLGIYDAMNKGLCMAQGTYAYWLNSGDELLSDTWNQIQSILTTSKADLLAFATYFLWPDSRLHRIFYPTLDLLPMKTFNHQGCFFRTSTVRQLSGYRTKFRYSADRDLILRIFLSGRTVVCHDLIIANFYIDGVSSNMSQLYLDNLRVDRDLALRTSLACNYLFLRHKTGQILRALFGIPAF